MRVVKVLCWGIWACGVWANAQEALFGRVYEERTGRPLNEVDILLPSGKKISSNRPDGRFELAVPHMKGKLVFSRKGFEIDTLFLNEISDPYNVEVYLTSKVERLETGSATSSISVSAPTREMHFLSPEKLELFAGMQLDPADQARALPGVSATREFRDDRSFLGGIPGSNSTQLGPLAMIKTRHLDIGLPGNTSVISPLWVSDYTARPGATAERPMTAGGGDLEMSLRPVKADALQGSLRGGSVLREVQLETPFVGDGLRLGFRLLDGDVMSNLGNKYFAEFRKRGEEDSCIDPCKTSDFGNQYDLTSYDFFLQNTIKDSSGQFDIFWHQISDQYSIRLDTAHSYAVIGNQRVEIFKGIQEQMAGGVEYTANEGWGVFATWQKGEWQNIQRDSAALWSSQTGSLIYREDLNLLENQKSQFAQYDLGAHFILLSFEEGWMDLGIEYRNKENQRAIRMPATLKESDEVSQELAGVLTLQQSENVKLSAGYRQDLESAEAQPLATLEFGLPQGDWRPYTAMAWNGDLVWEKSGAGGYQSRYQSSGLGQLGIEFQNKKLEMNFFGFGRYYPDASLPRPEVLTAFRMSRSSSPAWIGGGGAQFKYAPHYQHGIFVNLLSQYGEYSDIAGLALPSSRKLELQLSWRWYPRQDSLISMIVSHRTALGEPTYSYGANLNDESLSVEHNEEELATHRTDLRLQLNLSSAWPPLQSVQFYLELDNVFAAFDSEALAFLGEDNARQRGYTSVSRGNFEEGYRRIDPFLAPGMGFFLQFGVEGRFGF